MDQRIEFNTEYADGSAPSKRRSLLRRLLTHRSVQLVAHVALATLLPTIFWAGIREGELSDPNYQNTLWALGAVAIASWFILGQLRAYAKARLLSYVLPINFAVIAIALAIIAVTRAEYSAYQFAFGSAGVTIASYFSAVVTRGINRPHFLVPGGRIGEIQAKGQFIPAPSLIELESFVQAGRLEGAIVADLHHDHPDEWERLFAGAALAGIPVYHYKQVAEMHSGQVKITHLAENDLGSLIPNVPYMATKRLIDIVGSLLLLPLLLPLAFIIAALIKLDSKGSAIFIQERMGFRGQSFRMFKFRTMRTAPASDSSEDRRDVAMTKADDDRVTRIGRFLRKTRIDELPQILNILRGEMSWIGPRPEAVALSEWYEEELPFYSYRHIVRPGITGWAQVNQGHVTDVEDANAKLRYDFYYVKNISFWLDTLIALKTLRVIATGNGAK